MADKKSEKNGAQCQGQAPVATNGDAAARATSDAEAAGADVADNASDNAAGKTVENTAGDSAMEDPEGGEPAPEEEGNADNLEGADSMASPLPVNPFLKREASKEAEETVQKPEKESAAEAGNSPGQENEPETKEADAEEDDDEAEEEKTMGLLDHLNELRARLVRACIAVAVCFGICWAFVDPLFNILLSPLLAVLPPGTHAQYTTLPEAFFTRMYIAFVAAIFLASPVIFYQIWAFVAPGLYDEEKRYIVPIAFLSAIFFVCGAIFCYFIVFPFAFNFFISYSTPEIVTTPKVSDYLSFVIKLLFAFGLIFEMPIFTLFLARLGIVTAAMMRRARKYAIVAIFILAAILTPPDVVSQLLMACPMLLLYELSIGVAVVFGRRKKPAPDSGEDSQAGDDNVR